MCGITGFVDFTKKSKKTILQSMTNVLAHRGPEDYGELILDLPQATIGLGHRRLAIIDISDTGKQPMMFDNLNIIFNGEIYNYKEIKKILISEGYTFTTKSDTEVILKAFHKWNVKAIDRFIGMFAFVIFDATINKMYIFRDRIGVKPLFYYFENGLFLFASELKAFHKNPSFKNEIDLNNLAQYIERGYFPTPLSVFKNTYKLLPGHYLELNLKQKEIQIFKYWDVIDYYNLPKLSISESEILEELESLLLSSTKYRMVADVPVGIFLSGGYDSSLVAAMLQKEKAEKLNTFTIGFKEEEYNESEHASKIAEYLGTNHHEYTCTYKDAQDIFPLLPTIYDEPFGDSSGIPTTLVSRFAKQTLKVVNSGDGSEEVFAGYSHYLKSYSYIVNNEALFKSMIFPVNLLSSLFQSKKFPVFTNYIDKINSVLGVYQKDSYSYFHPLIINKVSLSHTYFNDIKKLNSENEYSNKILAIDFKTRLLDDFLVKIDRATMSTGLESREPLLDHRIVEFMAQIPMDIKCKNGTTKYLLKQIAHKYIPKELLIRPKMGFRMPIDSWLRNELKDYTHQYLSFERIKQEGIFHASKVNRLKKLFFENKLSYQNSERLKLILFFEMWYEKWM